MAARSAPEGAGGRSLCLTQIWTLQEQLDRVQLKCKELDEQNTELCSQYEVLDKVTRDSIRTLKPGVADRVKRVDELSEQQRREEESARRHSEEQATELQELQELLHRQEAEKSQQELEFKEQEEELMRLNQTLGEFAAGLEKRLADQEEANEAATHSLKIQTEMVLNRLEVPLSLPRRVESDTVVKMRAVLAVEQEKLLDQQVEMSECSHQLDLLQKDMDELTRHRADLDTDVKRLAESFQELWMDSGCRSVARQNAEKRDAALRQDLASTSEAYSQNKGATSLQQTDLKGWRNERQELECVREEAIIVLRHILTESSEDEMQWKTERLLDMVDSVVPNKAESAERRTTRKKVEIRGLHPLGRVRR